MNADWFRAADQGNTQVISSLLDSGADANMRGEYGWTALMLAVAGRHIVTIEALLRRGADPNAECNHGGTAMTWAALQARGWQVHQGRCAPTLLPNMRPLQLVTAWGGRLGLREAILLGDVELAQRLCDRDGSIEVNSEAKFGMHETYLMLAAELGPVAMVDCLLDRGADIEGTDDIGHTALMRAAEMGRMCIVTRLLDRGAEINWGWPDESAMTVAQFHGHQDLTALLLSRGARRNLRDAIERDDLQLAQELLDGGTDPDDYDWDRRTLTLVRHVMRAVSRGQVKMVRLFLDKSASHNVPWRDDRSLLAEASKRGHVDVVRLLIAHGADLHAVGRDGNTALNWASEGGHEQIAAELKQAGAVT